MVSLAPDARISSLLRKVEGDYRRKTQQAIKCKQLLVQDSFEIVDVYKSQVQHYLTDLMHVTVLAVKNTIAEKKAVEVAKIVPDEAPATTAGKKRKAGDALVSKPTTTSTPPVAKRQLSSSISISSEDADAKIESNDASVGSPAHDSDDSDKESSINQI